LKYREFLGVDFSLISFGTATFVEGKYSKHANSLEGIRTLRCALIEGINTIHINMDLGTAWGVREALGDPIVLEDLSKHNKQLNIILKVKLRNKDTDISEIVRSAGRIVSNLFEDTIKDTRIETNLVIEYEVKDPSLNTFSRVLPFLNKATLELRDYVPETVRKLIPSVWISSASHLNALLVNKHVTLAITKFSLLDSWVAGYLDTLLDEGIKLIAVRPLAKGVLTDERSEHNEELRSLLESIAKHYGIASYLPLQITALRFVVSHPSVLTATVGVSKVKHLYEILATLNAFIDKETFSRIVAVLPRSSPS